MGDAFQDMQMQCKCTHTHTHTPTPNSLTHRPTHIESPEQKEGGLQAHWEYEAQDGGGDEGADAVGLRQHYNYGQRHQHGHPQQPRQVRLQRTCGVG